MPAIAADEHIDVSFRYMENFTISGTEYSLWVNTPPARAEVRPGGRYFVPLVFYENNPEVTVDVILVDDLTGDSVPLAASPYTLAVQSALDALLKMTRFNLPGGVTAAAGEAPAPTARA